MLTSVSGRGLGLHAAPSLPCITTNKAKVFCPRSRQTSTATKASSSGDYSSSDDNSSIPSSSSSSPVPDTLPVAGVDTDWRAFRARLVASSSGLSTDTTSAAGETQDDDIWAHEITTLEPGCVLLASPEYFTHSQTYFGNAIILLAQHAASHGSIGFILNKPTEYKIAQVNGKGALPEPLNPCTLYLGGDVNKESINVLHSVPDLVDSNEIVPGVFLGGIHELGRKVDSGAITPPEVKILVGMAGWGPGQLQEEVARGVWIVASASKQLLLSPSVAGMGKESWHLVMQLMGGDYAGLSQAVKETYRADIMEFKGQSIYSTDSNSNTNINDTTAAPLNENEDNDNEEPRGGGGEPSSPSSAKGPWKPPRRDPGHNFGSGI